MKYNVRIMSGQGKLIATALRNEDEDSKIAERFDALEPAEDVKNIRIELSLADAKKVAESADRYAAQEWNPGADDEREYIIIRDRFRRIAGVEPLASEPSRTERLTEERDTRSAAVRR